MSVTDRSRERVDRVLDRLRADYGDFAVVEKTWEHDAATMRATRERFEREGLGGAGVWVTNDAGEVLLVRNEGDREWADPGGKVEGEESFAAAAVREVREETGVECSITGLLAVHVVKHRPAGAGDPSGGDAAPLFGPIVLFEARAATRVPARGRSPLSTGSIDPPSGSSTPRSGTGRTRPTRGRRRARAASDDERPAA